MDIKANKKKIIPAVVLVAVAGLSIYFLYFRNQFFYTGTVEATKVDISARTGSVIESIDILEGQHIQSDQLLLRLTCEDHKITASLANENYQRALKLFSGGSQSKEAFDLLKNRKDEADLRLSWCIVKSPIAGTVLNKYHEPGEWVNQGTRLFTLANIKEIYTYVYVPQPLIAKLALGMKVTGYLPEMDMRPFEGTVTLIGEQAEFTPKNVQTRDERTRLVFGVKISFNNSEEILKPGMSIEVKLPKA